MVLIRVVGIYLGSYFQTLFNRFPASSVVRKGQFPAVLHFKWLKKLSLNIDILEFTSVEFLVIESNWQMHRWEKITHSESQSKAFLCLPGRFQSTRISKSSWPSGQSFRRRWRICSGRLPRVPSPPPLTEALLLPTLPHQCTPLCDVQQKPWGKTGVRQHRGGWDAFPITKGLWVTRNCCALHALLCVWCYHNEAKKSFNRCDVFSCWQFPQCVLTL